jgi:hypothetical protein
MIGGEIHLLEIIRNILAYNYTIIDYKKSKLKELLQTVVVL